MRANFWRDSWEHYCIWHQFPMKVCWNFDKLSSDYRLNTQQNFVACLTFLFLSNSRRTVVGWCRKKILVIFVEISTKLSLVLRWTISTKLWWLRRKNHHTYNNFVEYLSGLSQLRRCRACQFDEKYRCPYSNIVGCQFRKSQKTKDAKWWNFRCFA